MKCSFFGREVWKTKSGVGLDDTERGQTREVKAFGNHLSADDDVVVATINFVVNFGEFEVVISIHVETGDFSAWEETMEFVFDELGAEAFVMNAGVFTFWAGGWNWEVACASVATHLESVCM